MAKARWILHADMDAFFASVEQRDDPSLRGRPVIVGGTSNRGVVSAASYEARKFGVRSAMPTYRAKELCPSGVFLAGDMQKYLRTSREIHAIFERFTDQIEPIALDEAFLDITGSLALLGDPASIGRKLKEEVWQSTSLRVSVGIAPNKLVAKIACSLGKPDGLKLVEPERVREVLAPLPIRRLWGVGGKAEKKLATLGIHTFADLATATPDRVALAFGRFAGEMMARAQGIDDRPVATERSPKSIGEESTFGEDVTDPRRLLEAVVGHSEAVASRARRAGYQGHVVTLKVKYAGRRRGEQLSVHELFESHSRQRSLERPTADGGVIASVARELLSQLDPKPVRLLGVSLAGLVEATRVHNAGPAQLELEFSAPTRAQPRPDLGQIMDAVNDKFGSGTLRRAVRELEKLGPQDRAKLGDR